VIHDSRVLAIIVGRGGSKGLPRKNVRALAGKPLIAWSIEAASKSRFLDRTIVSTDDAEIAAVARAHGGDVPFLRPAELADDEAPIIDTILHATDSIAEQYRYVVMLQATSPLRLGSDIDEALTHCGKLNAPACVSIVPEPKMLWALTMKPTGQLVLPPGIATRRQDLTELYQPNGAIYIAELEWLKRNRDFYAPETVGFVMPPERSVDIDTMADLIMAEALMTARKGN
jgi:N-acylneuraminate cytidylyltransferase